VVTGASKGIGHGIASAFVDAGAHVLLVARGAEDLERAATELRRTAAEVYGTTRASERHRHRYEVNNRYRDRIAEAGLVFSGINPDLNLVEYVELPRDVHPYYIATQAHPELRSRPTDANPLFRGLVGAALERHRASELFEVEPFDELAGR
jgi:CTP synthase (UTP-ammonia lyase)